MSTKQEPCKNCGACPCCGRGGYAVKPIWVDPRFYQPWPQPWPYWHQPYWQSPPVISTSPQTTYISTSASAT